MTYRPKVSLKTSIFTTIFVAVTFSSVIYFLFFSELLNKKNQNTVDKVITKNVSNDFNNTKNIIKSDSKNDLIKKDLLESIEYINYKIGYSFNKKFDKSIINLITSINDYKSEGYKSIDINITPLIDKTFTEEILILYNNDKDFLIKRLEEKRYIHVVELIKKENIKDFEINFTKIDYILTEKSRGVIIHLYFSK